MTLQIFEPEDTRSQVADWFELQLLRSNGSSIGDAVIRRAQSIASDSGHDGEWDSESAEELDEEILDTDEEALVDDVYQELLYRSKNLGAAYPFEPSSRGARWSLQLKSEVAQLSVAQKFYVCCLLMSGSRYSMLRLRDAGATDPTSLEKRLAHHFQAMSYLVAGGIIGGHAYWFGWPRPDKSNYPKALANLVLAVGHGKLKINDPEWSNGYEKDGTVDIVAWRSFRDRHPGTIIVYGQVASGRNWTEKPVSGFIKGHFLDWFEDTFSATWIPALFMPFPLHEQVAPNARYTFDEVASGMARRNERDYGTIIDRLRLVQLAEEIEAEGGFADPQHNILIVDLAEWADACLVLLRK